MERVEQHQQQETNLAEEAQHNVGALGMESFNGYFQKICEMHRLTSTLRDTVESPVIACQLRDSSELSASTLASLSNLVGELQGHCNEFMLQLNKEFGHAAEEHDEDEKRRRKKNNERKKKGFVLTGSKKSSLDTTSLPSTDLLPVAPFSEPSYEKKPLGPLSNERITTLVKVISGFCDFVSQ